MSAWDIASAVGIILLATNTPFGALYALPITFILAAGIYAVSLTVAKADWFVMKRPFFPHDEVSDLWEDRIRREKCEKSYVAVDMDRDPSNGHKAICSALRHRLSVPLRGKTRIVPKCRRHGRAAPNNPVIAAVETSERVR